MFTAEDTESTEKILELFLHTIFLCALCVLCG
jgi:hypothetical protein